MKTTTLATVCPICKHRHDVTSSVTDAFTPSNGDVTMCLNCGDWSVFEQGALRRPTAAELDEIRANDVCKRMVQAWLVVAMLRHRGEL